MDFQRIVELGILDVLLFFFIGKFQKYQGMLKLFAVFFCFKDFWAYFYRELIKNIFRVFWLFFLVNIRKYILFFFFQRIFNMNF